MAITTIEYCALCNAVYDGSIPDGWEKLPGGWYAPDPESFCGQAYIKGTEIVLAIRGTSNIQDVETDVLLVLKEKGIHFWHVIEFYYSAIFNNPPYNNYENYPFSITGHSLGGALAQYLSYMLFINNNETPIPTETFNAPGIIELDNSITNVSGTGIINHMRAADIVQAVGIHVGSCVYYSPSDYPRGPAGMALSVATMALTRGRGLTAKAGASAFAQTVGYKFVQHSISYFYEDLCNGKAETVNADPNMV
ncbi:lipase family protein [Anaerosinus massiliensis]|uniref:lipase family protein n=1 Tax=Massilibacillus massiliensis TaxID=1806837 RepID=UPI000DA5F83E|nr:hypothetical protein [Massilibacillus massiliensis]